MKNNKRIFITANTEKTLKKITGQKLPNHSNKIWNDSDRLRLANKIGKQKLKRDETPLEFLELNDKITQKIICRILETIYKPYFFRPSFIFYPIFRAYNIFNYTESKLFWVNETIENPCLSINNIQFCNILNRRIQDNKFTILIYKLLKYETLEYYQFFQLNLNIFQNNITFTIFINIYFNELDNWIKYKIYALTQPLFYQHGKNYHQFFCQVKKKTKQSQDLEKTSKKYKIIQKKLTRLEEKKTKIISFSTQQTNYFRSFNNWVIGIRGEKFLIEKLKIETNHFLIVHLKQKIHSIKIKTIISPHKKTKFIGYRMSFLNNQKLNDCTQYSNSMRYQENLKKNFEIPTNFIFQKMKKEGYIKKLVSYYQSFDKINYMGSESMRIIKYFAQIWRGLLNYYAECNNLFKLQYVHYNLYLSFIMTLNRTHYSNMEIIVMRHGKMLRTFKYGVTINFPYKT